MWEAVSSKAEARFPLRRHEGKPARSVTGSEDESSSSSLRPPHDSFYFLSQYAPSHRPHTRSTVASMLCVCMGRIEEGGWWLPVVLTVPCRPTADHSPPQYNTDRPAKIARTPSVHLPSLAFSSTVLATMFSSSIKREKKGNPGLQGGLHRRCVAERGGGGGGERPSACALWGWTRGAGVSFTPRRCTSGLHFNQSRGVWNRMSHIRLQCKLGMLPAVGDAFLLQSLSTQNHSMRKFKQKNQMWVTESLRCAKQSSRQQVPDDCREGTFRLDPSRRVTGILAAFA